MYNTYVPLLYFCLNSTGCTGEKYKPHSVDKDEDYSTCNYDYCNRNQHSSIFGEMNCCFTLVVPRFCLFFSFIHLLSSLYFYLST